MALLERTLVEMEATDALRDRVVMVGIDTDPVGGRGRLRAFADGLVGTEGMVEAKCPYWKKQVHFEIPLYYYMQINLCLDPILKRSKHHNI